MAFSGSVGGKFTGSKWIELSRFITPSREPDVLAPAWLLYCAEPKRSRSFKAGRVSRTANHIHFLLWM